ncbi:FecR family protein [Plebeiibacterium marinum]|uniref:FecR family protein n=1 Tax=Plebeiibacterium marinum TaxID=2992111 RepID=A0AAE3MBE1_9BACT|nr:FecR family protein [Plebeiobacterium marinum]MCW3804783.1 FecR family protein [Plebeiobacterium marinum]
MERIIVGYLTNDISEEEMLILNKWRGESAQNEDEFAKFEYVWNKSQHLKVFESIDVQGDFEIVKNVLQQNGTKGVSRKLNVVFGLRKMAAVLLPALFLSTALFLYLKVPGFGRLTAYKSGDKIERIVLPDNSVVVLNKNSKLVYNKAINTQASREVYLNGEAFFDVTHNDTPFVVNVDDATVEVLGTEFNVNELNQQLSVLVVSGKVGVQAYEQRVELTKGERAIVKDGVVTEENILSYNDLYWKSSALKFEQASLKQICADLQKAFDEIEEVKYLCKDVDIKVTTTFENQDLKDILEELQIHFNKKIKLNGSVLTISD